MPDLLDIIGQDKAITQILRASQGGRVPHAMLFAGPEGVGRETTAAALASLLLCAKPASTPRSKLPGGRLADLDEDFAVPRPCGQCDDCRMMAKLSHPDFHPVYKELARYHEDSDVRGRVMQELGIDVIDRFLIRLANQAPTRGRGKVFVVREAELMSDAAQNALLKTLEEPPPGVTIILLANQPQQLLPTTISRCRVVQFGLLPHEFVARKLAEKDIEPVEAQFWADFTGGSIGRAIRLAAAEMYAVKRQHVERLAARPPGGEPKLGENLNEMTEKLAGAAIAAAKQSDGAALSENLAKRQAAGVMLELIASAYLDAMHVRTTADAGVAAPALTYRDQPSQIDALAKRFDARQLADVIEQLSDLEQFLWRNASGKLVWENVVITCASAAPLRIG